MGIENGMGYDPENVENSRSAEPPHPRIDTKSTRRSFVRRVAGVAGAVALEGAGLIRHAEQVAAQEATSQMIVPREGSTVVPNPDTLVDSGENAVETSRANESSINTGESQIVNPALENGEFDYLKERLEGPLDIDRKYINDVFPLIENQPTTASAVPQAELHAIVDASGSVILDYGLEHAIDLRGTDYQLKVNYFVLYPTAQDYQERKGVVIQATANTQSLAGDEAAESLFAGGQFRGFTIEAVGTMGGHPGISFAQTSSVDATLSGANNRPTEIEKQTPPAAITDVISTAAADIKRDRGGRDSGPHTKTDFSKSPVVRLLGAGAAAFVIAVTGRKKMKKDT